jgi:hypothetical protein
MRYQAALHPDLAPYLVASSPQGNPPNCEKRLLGRADLRPGRRARRRGDAEQVTAPLSPHCNQNARSALPLGELRQGDKKMNGIIYLVGLVVVVLAVLSFFGLR